MEEEGEERVFFSWTRMNSSPKYEARLEGISNYLQWKVSIVVVLGENKLLMFVSTTMTMPSSYPISLDLHKVKESRVRRIILDGVRDHLIPHLDEKFKSKEMWVALTNLYERKKENKNMALRENLHCIRMAKGESVASYLTRHRQVKDELEVIGEIIPNSELIRIALKGFTKEWDVFMKCVVGRKKLPD